MAKIRGRCLCGRTGFEFDDDRMLWQVICHCESCRRAASAPMVGWIGVADDGWRWTGDEPVSYESSPGAERGFCAGCGSPMFFRSARWPGETHFYGASLEDPAEFRPSMHVNWDDALPWPHLCDDLPRKGKTDG